MKFDFVGKCLLISDENERILVIGDLHLGYEGAMRDSGIMIPARLYEKCIEDFDKVIEAISGFVDKIIILGDLKHEFGFILNDEWKNIVKFIEQVKTKCRKLIVIEGNHDPILFPVLNKMGIRGKDFHVWNGIAFAHGDKEFDELNSKEITHWIIGHGHPAITLSDGVKKEKYKCFLDGSYGRKKVIIVPSFFPLIEGTDAREFDLGLAWKFNLRNFNVVAVGEDLKTLNFGKLGKIKIN